MARVISLRCGPAAGRFERSDRGLLGGSRAKYAVKLTSLSLSLSLSLSNYPVTSSSAAPSSALKAHLRARAVVTRAVSRNRRECGVEDAEQVVHSRLFRERERIERERERERESAVA